MPLEKQVLCHLVVFLVKLNHSVESSFPKLYKRSQSFKDIKVKPAYSFTCYQILFKQATYKSHSTKVM